MSIASLWQRRHWPIAVKWAVDLVLAAIIPLCIVVWLALAQSRDGLEKASQDNLQLVAKVTAARLDQLCVDTARTVRQVARDDSVVALCRAAQASVATQEHQAAAQRRIEAVVQTNEDCASMFVASTTGIGLVGTNPMNIGMDFNFREYYRSALNGEHFRSPWLVGKTTHQPGVYFSAPVRAVDDPDQTVLGVVVFKLRGESLQKIIREVSVGEQGYAMLVNGSGVVLAHPQDEFLYHSLGPLSAEDLRQINPQLTFSQKTIKPLPFTNLREPLTDDSAEGSLPFTISGEALTNWVAGYAKLQQRPWKVAVVESEAQFLQPISTLLQRQIAIGAVVAILAVVLAVWHARSIVKPLLAVSRAARQLALGDFSARAVQTTEDEVGQLAATFNTMVPQLKEKVELQTALGVAKEVQQSLLPAENPSHPRLDICGRSWYCDETGGDYYDFIPMRHRSHDGLLIAVGDVMGHGIAAALLMASARAAVRSYVKHDQDLSALMTEVNRVLAEEARHDRFMTMTMFTVDPTQGTVYWASAGHDPPLIYHPREERFEQLEGGSIPLAIMPSMDFEEYQYHALQPGDVLLLGTDGIWEARNSAGEFFGKERLCEILAAHHERPADEITLEVERALRGFRGPTSQEDDITLVITKIKSA